MNYANTSLPMSGSTVDARMALPPLIPPTSQHVAAHQYLVSAPACANVHTSDGRSLRRQHVGGVAGSGAVMHGAAHDARVDGPSDLAALAPSDARDKGKKAKKKMACHVM